MTPRPSRSRRRFLAAAGAAAAAGSAAWFAFARSDDEEEDDDRKPTFEAVLRLRAGSTPATPDEIQPYDESLFVQEYEVVRMIDGTIDAPVIRIARWAVLGGDSVAPRSIAPGESETLRFVAAEDGGFIDGVHLIDELPLAPELPHFLEEPSFAGLATDDIPEALRFDYRSKFSERMRIYWLVRRQLEVVVIGNSHGETGVDSRQFFPARNAVTPVALNLSKPGADFRQQELIVTDYVQPLPALRWLVWCLSPRLFNAHHRAQWRLATFRESPGHRYDQANQADLWPIDAAGDQDRVPLADVEALNDNFNAWGGTGHDGIKKEFRDPQARRALILKDADDRDFKWNESVGDSIESIVEGLAARGVRSCLFLPAFHPDLAEADQADIDGTGIRDARRIRERLEAIAARFPDAAVLVDLHNGGDSGFPPEAFWDADHLNRSGCARQTERLVQAMARLDPDIAR